MKRITTIFMFLMLVFMGAGADVNAPTNYVSSIQTGVNYLWCLDDGNHPRYIHADGTKTASDGHLTGAAIFQFEDAGDNYYYIKEVGSGKYMYTDYADDVTQITAAGTPWAYTSNNVLAAGTKEDADKFKWQVSEGSLTNGFFISSKVNVNAVLAATSQGNTGVYFYQYTTSNGGNAKYPFANSKFIKVATSLSEVSNDKCYNICNYQAWWAVGSGATEVNSTYANDKGLNLAVSTSDTKQQFAFIKYIDKYYLYSVGEGKFAYKNGTKLSLADGFNNNVTSNGAVTFVTSTSSSYKSSAPVIVTVASKNFGVSKNFSPTVLGYDDASDNGNASAVCEAGSFTPTTALAQIESSFLFEPSTDLAPKYYAWRTAVDNKPSYIHIESGNPKNQNNHNITVTDPIDATYAWYFIGDPENGYAIKNKSTGTYLGGRTSSGGYMSMEASNNCKFYPINEVTATPTWNTWYDKEHNYYIDRADGSPYAHTSGNKNDYIRLYNVKFSLSDAAAGLVVGSTTISDFTAYYLITSSASLSCAESSYTITAYDGYSTLAEALTNDDDGTINVTVKEGLPISYKLLWQGNELTSATAVKYQEPGESVIAAATVFGAAPAYCTYTDVSISTIGAETTEVTYTLSWDGPFDFSTDYAHAKWYYLGINRSTADDPEYCVYSASTPYQLVSLEDAQSAGYNGIWAFVGNPYDGVRIVNHGSGEGYYLNLSTYPSMVNATYPTYSLLRIKAHTNGAGFTLDNDDCYLCNYNNYNTTDVGLRFFDAAYAAYHQTCITVSAVPYKTLELLDLEAYANSHALGQYFGVDETAYNTMVESVNAQETVTESDYNTFSSMMSGYMNPRLPESGYYRIKSSGSRGRTSYITYGKLNDEKGFGLVTTSNDKNGDYGTVIKLTRVGNGKNYQISVQGLNVQVHSGDNTLFTATESGPLSFAFNHISLSGKCSINDGSTTHGYLHEANWYNSTTGLNGVVGWDEGDGSNASTWSLEDVSTISVTMNDGGDDHTYATLYLPFGVTIDSGSDVDAYIMTIVGEVASGTNIGKDIPANTGVILKGTDASVTLTINDDATATTTNNDLEGTCVVKDARENVEGVYDLVLGKGTTSNTLGFYLAPEGAKLAANKAYLPYRPAAVGARVNGFAIQWDDETTGIRSIDNGKQSVKNGAIYDLQGRKVANPSRGMYIVNGRKVVVK